MLRSVRVRTKRVLRSNVLPEHFEAFAKRHPAAMQASRVFGTGT